MSYCRSEVVKSVERVKDEQVKAKALGIELQLEKEKLERTLQAQASTAMMYIRNQNGESFDSSPKKIENSSAVD